LVDKKANCKKHMFVYFAEMHVNLPRFRYKILKLSSTNVEVAEDCKSVEPIAEFTVISATVDGINQPENSASLVR